jgi:hypothetical protein
VQLGVLGVLVPKIAPLSKLPQSFCRSEGTVPSSKTQLKGLRVKPETGAHEPVRQARAVALFWTAPASGLAMHAGLPSFLFPTLAGSSSEFPTEWPTTTPRMT